MATPDPPPHPTLDLGETVPVIVGEFGCFLTTAGDREWLEALCGYMASKGLHFAYWCLGPNSHDTGGLLQVGFWDSLAQYLCEIP